MRRDPALRISVGRLIMLVDDILPARLLRSLWGRWYWILLGGFLGGLLGWGLTFLKTPEYEASAALSIGFDYARVNEMDDPVTSYVTLRVRDLLLSDETAQSALDSLKVADPSRDIPTDIAQLRSRIRLVEDGSRWDIVASAHTPDGSAAIANAWADSALQGLEQAMLHAIRAADLETAIYRAGCKLVQDPSSPNLAIWDCRVPEDTLRPSDFPEALLNEANLSKGLLPSMSFSMLGRAEPPARAILWGRGVLILAGVVFGMWLCALAIIVRDGVVAPNRVASNPAGRGRA
jgi:hypothetical protein